MPRNKKDQRAGRIPNISNNMHVNRGDASSRRHVTSIINFQFGNSINTTSVNLLESDANYNVKKANATNYETKLNELGFNETTNTTIKKFIKQGKV